MFLVITSGGYSGQLVKRRRQDARKVGHAGKLDRCDGLWVHTITIDTHLPLEVRRIIALKGVPLPKGLWPILFKLGREYVGDVVYLVLLR